MSLDPKKTRVMAAKSHKMRVKLTNGKALVRMLLNHPMETGNRTDKLTGTKLPCHFIRELTCEHNGKPVLRSESAWGMARKPYLSFCIRDARP